MMRSPRTRTLLVVVSVLLILTDVILAVYVNRNVPEPYMDEIFHIPQAARYCHYDSTWDPMITTFPGLYYLAFIYFHVVAFGCRFLAIISPVIQCIPTPVILRFLNLMLSWATSIVVSLILKSERGQRGSGYVDDLLGTLWIRYLPVGFLYNFLFYTDAGSLFFLVAARWLVGTRRPRLAALCGACAVLFRQTAVVWVAYLAIWGILRDLHVDPRTPVARVLRRLWAELPEVLWRYFGFLLVGLGFAAFVLANGSLTLGDQAHHPVSFHGAHLLYFALFLCLSHGARVFPLARRALQAGIAQPARAVAVLVCVAGLLLCGSIGHPYLLADNRHYAFYLWKDILRPAAPGVPLVPSRLIREPRAWGLIAFHSATASVALAAFREHVLLRAAFLGALVLQLVPAPLFEPRYAIVPLAFAALQSRPAARHTTLLACASSALVSYVTVAAFVWFPLRGDQTLRLVW